MDRRDAIKAIGGVVVGAAIGPSVAAGPSDIVPPYPCDPFTTLVYWRGDRWDLAAINGPLTGLGIDRLSTRQGSDPAVHRE